MKYRLQLKFWDKHLHECCKCNFKIKKLMVILDDIYVLSLPTCLEDNVADGKWIRYCQLKIALTTGKCP